VPLLAEHGAWALLPGGVGPAAVLVSCCRSYSCAAAAGWLLGSWLQQQLAVWRTPRRRAESEGRRLRPDLDLPYDTLLLLLHGHTTDPRTS
jgi:hypothetical protein